MKARGSRFVIILGAGLAALAFVVVYLVMTRTAGQAQQPVVPVAPQMSNVAVVSRDLPAYTVLDSSNVSTISVEASTVPSNTTGSPETVFGKMTLTPYKQGQPVQLTQLTDTGFSNILDKGEKAFTLAVNEPNTFAAGITENDRVDVLWTASYQVNVPLKAANNQVSYEKTVYTSTKTLLQDLKVLRVVDLRTVVAPQGGNNSESSNASATRSPAGTVTGAAMYNSDAPYASAIILAVTDQQAEVLKFARENGWIDLTLRSSAATQDNQGKTVQGDHEVEKTTGVTIDVLVKQYGLLPPPAEWQVGTGATTP